MLLVSRVVLLIVLCTGGEAAHAATYYVATDGDDTRSTATAQNIATPWQTIKKATANMIAGDITYVRGGTYSTNLITFANSGSSDSSLITLAAYPGETPIIDGGISSFSENPGFSIDGKSYIKIQGFTITNVGRAGIRVGENYEETNIWIIENDISNVWAPGTGDNSGGVYLGQYANNVHIVRNKMHHGQNCTGDTSSCSGVIMFHPRNIEIRGNEVYSISGAGIHIKHNQNEGYRCVIEDNYVHNIGAAYGIGIKLGAGSDCAVNNNLITRLSGDTWSAGAVKNGSSYVIPTQIDHQYFYKFNGYLNGCTVSCTTGATEPTWPTGASATVDDGDIQWVNKGTKYHWGIWVFDESAGCSTLITRRNSITHNTIAYVGTGIEIRITPSSGYDCEGAVHTKISNNLIYQFWRTEFRGIGLGRYNPAAWTANTAISVGAPRDARASVSDNGYLYQSSYINGCTGPCNTGAVEPTWPTTLGGTVDDGDIRWTNMGSNDVTDTTIDHNLVYSSVTTSEVQIRSRSMDINALEASVNSRVGNIDTQPTFVDVANGDWRLAVGSAGKGAASDGGDMGACMVKTGPARCIAQGTRDAATVSAMTEALRVTNQRR